MRPPLTDKEEKILHFIAACYRDNGFPPSFREIGQHISVKSTSDVHRMLGQLEGKGYLQRIPGKSRALKVVV